MQEGGDAMTKTTEDQPAAVPAGLHVPESLRRVLGLGRTDGLDGAHVDGPRTGGQRRPDGSA